MKTWIAQVSRTPLLPRLAFVLIFLGQTAQAAIQNTSPGVYVFRTAVLLYLGHGIVVGRRSAAYLLAAFLLLGAAFTTYFALRAPDLRDPGLLASALWVTLLTATAGYLLLSPRLRAHTGQSRQTQSSEA